MLMMPHHFDVSFSNKRPLKQRKLCGKANPLDTNRNLSLAAKHQNDVKKISF
jgi:hypothetical protein